MRKGLALPPASTAGASRVAMFSCADMPSPLPRWDRRRLSLCRFDPASQPTMSAFSVIQALRLPRYPFRGLLGVHSRYGLPARQITSVILCTEDSGGFVTSTAAPIATGWSDQLPGGSHSR
jgi:hypothetical protein